MSTYIYETMAPPPSPDDDDHDDMSRFYKPGSIRRIRLKDFLTYSEVEFSPGPRYGLRQPIPPLRPPDRLPSPDPLRRMTVARALLSMSVRILRRGIGEGAEVFGAKWWRWRLWGFVGGGVRGLPLHVLGGTGFATLTLTQTESIDR